MLNLLARSLSYHQLPGSPFLGFTEKERHDRAYRFWLEFWTGVLKANGTDAKPNPDDFLRQTVVGVLEHKGQVVALHASSYFDLSALGPRDHSYFTKFYTKEYLDSLKKEGAAQVLSMEMYSVLREWRSPKVGVSLAAVLIGLAIKLAQSWNVDAAIGVARMDVGVHNLVQDQGAVVLGPQVEIYNTPCKQIAFFPDAMKPHPDAHIADLVEHFWKNRADASRSSGKAPVRKAA